MAQENKFSVPAHPSIYAPAERKLDIVMSYPDEGINKDTGILLLIPSYGDNNESELYQEARHKLAETCNLLVVQCEYFGLRFMQSINRPHFNINFIQLKSLMTEEDYVYVTNNSEFNINKLFELGDKYSFALSGNESMEETLENFNDMGIMQAIDNITAVLAAIEIIRDNEYAFNKNKIMAYGVGHGAYLGYMCNAFAPHLFHLLLDNSSWLISPYLKRPRIIHGGVGHIKLKVQFDYLAMTQMIDQEIFDLQLLYKKFHNNCNIVSFHGSSDENTNYMEKLNFCNAIRLCMCNEITKSQVDGKFFHSSGFGLDADFIGLFQHVYSNFKLSDHGLSTLGTIQSHKINTKKFEYQFDYSTGALHLTRLIKG